MTDLDIRRALVEAAYTEDPDCSPAWDEVVELLAGLPTDEAWDLATDALPSDGTAERRDLLVEQAFTSRSEREQWAREDAASTAALEQESAAEREKSEREARDRRNDEESRLRYRVSR